MTVLAAICLTQAFMMWKFINFQLRRWREHAQAQTLKKKPVQPSKSKSKKDKGEWAARPNVQVSVLQRTGRHVPLFLLRNVTVHVHPTYVTLLCFPPQPME